MNTFCVPGGVDLQYMSVKKVDSEFGTTQELQGTMSRFVTYFVTAITHRRALFHVS